MGYISKLGKAEPVERVLRLEAPSKVQMEMREMRQGVLKVMEKSREEAQQQQPWQQEVCRLTT